MRMYPQPLPSPVRYANRRRPQVELLIARGADVLGHADWLRHRGLAHTPAASPMSPGWTGEAPARFRTKPVVDMAGCGCIPATLPPDDGSMFFAGKRPLTGARIYAPATPRAVRSGRARQVEQSHFAPDTDTFIDVHSHNFGLSELDSSGVSLHTVQERLIDRLYELSSYGVSRMVIAGKVDPEMAKNGLAAKNSKELNGITLKAWQEYPDYFIPFASLIAIDSKEFGALSMFLDLGFQGIGEILVHGHHSHCFDNSDLLTICKFGAKYKVPVMFHWDCGTIDTDESVTTTTENMRQFLWLLNFIIMAGIDCDVVLAHCAAGPTAGAWPNTTDVDYLNFVEFIGILLSTPEYDFVHFDLGGMQIGSDANTYSVRHLLDTSGTPTVLGAFLLTQIAAYPDRFMVGIDMDNQHATQGVDTSVTPVEHWWGVSNFGDSIALYRNFLSGLDPSVQAAVLHGNAAVLYP